MYCILGKSVHDGTKTNCKKMWQYPGRKLDWRFIFPSPRGPLNWITIFWEETQCSLLNKKQGFPGICSLHLQGRSVNWAEFLETLVSMYQTTRHHMTKVLYFFYSPSYESQIQITYSHKFYFSSFSITVRWKLELRILCTWLNDLSSFFFIYVKSFFLIYIVTL